MFGKMKSMAKLGKAPKAPGFKKTKVGIPKPKTSAFAGFGKVKAPKPDGTY